MISKEF